MESISPLQSLYPEELYKLNRKVLILISKPWNDISMEEKILLEKILGSIKLNLASVQIIKCNEFQIQDFELYTPTCIIAFGVTAKIDYKKYEHLFVGKTSVIFADELSQLDDAKKRNLWVTLKQLFNPKQL